MKNRLILLSQNLSDLGKLQTALVGRGNLDFSFVSCASFEEFLEEVKNAKMSAEKCLIFCKNDQIDALVQEVASSGDKLSLMFEQAVKLENERGQMLFLPLEVELDKFLDDFLETKPTFSCLVFGKSVNFVEDKLSERTENDYKIITKSQFLHKIIFLNLLDEEWLKLTFGDGVVLGDDLAFECEKILKDKNLSLATAEQITAGAISSCFKERECLKSCQILFSKEDFEKLSGCALEELNSKEAVYETSKKLLKDADIALTVVGDFDGKTLLAVGDKEKIYVFSSVFQGKREDVFESIRDFALFRLYRFLNEKYCKKNDNLF